MNFAATAAELRAQEIARLKSAMRDS